MRKVIALMLMLVLVQVAAGTAYAGTILREGQSKDFFGTTTSRTLKVVSISDSSEKVIFSLGNELSKALNEREKHRFSDGSLVIVAQVLVNEGAEVLGDDIVQFYFVGGSSSTETFTDGEYDLSGLSEQYTSIERPAVIGVEDTLSKVECLTNSHCNDNNPCSRDTCANGVCVHAMMKGCPIVGECISFGTKITNGAGLKYCDVSGEFYDVRSDGQGCLEDYQCKNDCVNGVCVSEVEEPVVEPKVEPQVEEPVDYTDFPTPEPGPGENLFKGLFARFWRYVGLLFLQ